VERPQKTGTWYMPHGFMIRGWIHHSECTTNRVFEDVPRNVPTLWMARSWVYSNNDLLHLLTHHKLEALEDGYYLVKCGTGKT
jgi:hypothetical protein